MTTRLSTAGLPPPHVVPRGGACGSEPRFRVGGGLLSVSLPLAAKAALPGQQCPAASLTGIRARRRAAKHRGTGLSADRQGREVTSPVHVGGRGQ